MNKDLKIKNKQVQKKLRFFCTYLFPQITDHRSQINLGFALVEVLVATAIITGSVIATINVAQKSIQISRLSLHQAQATLLLEEGAEAVRSIRDTSWTGISSLASGTSYYPTYTGIWVLSPTSSTIGSFTRTVTFTNVLRDSNGDIVSSGGTADTGTRQVTVSVSWSELGTTQTKSLSFYIANIF